MKQISDNDIYLLIKYIKSVLWRVAKRLSYIEDAGCLKVKIENREDSNSWKGICSLKKGRAYKIQFLWPVNVFPGAYKKSLLMHPVASTRGSILIIKPPLQGEFAVHKNKSLAFIMFTSIL